MHWQTDVYLAGFAPAFTLSQGASEAPANRQSPVSVVMQSVKKEKKEQISRLIKKLDKAIKSSNEIFKV